MSNDIRCPQCLSTNVECVEKPHHAHTCHDCGYDGRAAHPDTGACRTCGDTGVVPSIKAGGPTPRSEADMPDVEIVAIPCPDCAAAPPPMTGKWTVDEDGCVLWIDDRGGFAVADVTTVEHHPDLKAAADALVDLVRRAEATPHGPWTVADNTVQDENGGWVVCYQTTSLGDLPAEGTATLVADALNRAEATPDLTDLPTAAHRRCPNRTWDGHRCVRDTGHDGQHRKPNGRTWDGPTPDTGGSDDAAIDAFLEAVDAADTGSET